MSNDFNAYLSDEQRINILGQRIQQFAAEGYQLTLNRKLAEAKEDTEALVEIDKNVTMLSEAIKVYVEELNTIPQTEVTE
jgi:hypothetical protein